VARERVRQWEPLGQQPEKRSGILDAATSLGDLAALKLQPSGPHEKRPQGPVFAFGSMTSGYFVSSGPKTSRASKVEIIDYH